MSDSMIRLLADLIGTVEDRPQARSVLNPQDYVVFMHNTAALLIHAVHPLHLAAAVAALVPAFAHWAQRNAARMPPNTVQPHLFDFDHLLPFFQNPLPNAVIRLFVEFLECAHSHLPESLAPLSPFYPLPGRNTRFYCLLMAVLIPTLAAGWEYDAPDLSTHCNGAPNESRSARTGFPLIRGPHPRLMTVQDVLFRLRYASLATVNLVVGAVTLNGDVVRQYADAPALHGIDLFSHVVRVRRLPWLTHNPLFNPGFSWAYSAHHPTSFTRTRHVVLRSLYALHLSARLHHWTSNVSGGPVWSVRVIYRLIGHLFNKPLNTYNGLLARFGLAMLPEAGLLPAAGALIKWYRRVHGPGLWGGGNRNPFGGSECGTTFSTRIAFARVDDSPDSIEATVRLLSTKGYAVVHRLLNDLDYIEEFLAAQDMESEPADGTDELDEDDGARLFVERHFDEIVMRFRESSVDDAQNEDLDLAERFAALRTGYPRYSTVFEVVKKLRAQTADNDDWGYRVCTEALTLICEHVTGQSDVPVSVLALQAAQRAHRKWG
ncbi:hypothetical protein JCM10213_003507 [Rhodosporidiobolus nylandii]